MYKLINFKIHGNYEGNLVALEKGEDFPFDIKRVYYIWGTQHDVVWPLNPTMNSIISEIMMSLREECDG